MQCLLCKYKSTDIEKVKEHYLKSHNVDQNNIFFKKLIDLNKKKKNVIYRRKCNYCNEFVYLNKAEHDFLKHYEKGIVFGSGSGNDSSGNTVDLDVKKPVTVTYLGTIKKFETTFK